MNKDDLLKMLDLAGKEAEPKEATELAAPKSESTQSPDASLTALELDGWALRKGRDALDESERLQALEIDEYAAADFHAAAFDPDPQLVPECVDRLRHEFLQQLMETPDYQALHTTTMLNDAASAIAAHSFAEQFAALRQEQKGKDGKDATDTEMATLRAVGRALSEATEEVEELSEAVAALGMGPGAPGSNDPKAIASLFRRVRGNATLRKICELAGRYRRVAQSRQRQKSTHGMDDVVGVTLDGDLGKLLPVELAKLAMPELELDTLRRLVERQCMAREYRAVEPVGKGPIIVSVDESGSMQGDKIHTAKALALAMAWVARQQRRWCALCAYSGDSGERLLPLPPGRWDEGKLAEWLIAFIGRGSHLDVPVREMPRYYQQLKAPRGQTDVLFITDAICHIEAHLQSQFIAWKHQVQARLVTLVVGSEPGDLTSISDEVHQVATLSVTEEAVGRVLSL